MKFYELEQNKEYTFAGCPYGQEMNNMVKIVGCDILIFINGKWTSVNELNKNGGDFTFEWFNGWDYQPLYGKDRYETVIAKERLTIPIHDGDTHGSDLIIACNYETYRSLCSFEDEIFISVGNEYGSISIKDAHKILDFITMVEKCKEEGKNGNM